ncbi:transposase [uncultured Secundilactobacillus sp.]|uniref:transposase n=1 Tax=uncultured Secundilactobacillus sp. TaxID=2813935 RepID=UPI0025909165|nr:transposase [uncultured Secundilactobacillus sp.]
MSKQIIASVSPKIHPDLIALRCKQVWQAGQLSYPAQSADSFIISEVQSYCDEIEELNQAHDSLKKRLIAYADILPEFSLFTSIPGAGEISTALLLGFTGKTQRFSTYKQLNAYVGIDLRRIQSGGF